MSEPLNLLRKPAHRKRLYSARPFLITVLLFCAIAALALLADTDTFSSSLPRRVPHQRRTFGISHEPNQECRLVHDAKDKCAFVQANCPDEEAGIFSYLALYYCRLPHARPFVFMVLVGWLGLLFSTIGIAASDFFCVNLSTMSSLLGMSESLAGVTFLAFGNGSPDVFSTFAAMSTNSGSLAVGELIGAAGFITAVVAGSMALVRPFKVAKKSFVRDVGFFIVAAGFSMTFLYDGKLYLWESVTMVAFYIFYVLFVIIWHWWLNRSRQRRQKEAAVRAQYAVPGGEELDMPEEYHDDEDATVEPRPSGRNFVDDITSLERGAAGEGEGDDDDDDDVRDRWLGELNSNMRLSRPRPRSRRNTQNPIRPSLVGALEFRAVLSSLKKSRNIHSIPIHLRRYSDDPTFSARQQDQLSTISDPPSRHAFRIDTERTNGSPGLSQRILEARGGRLRAVSANDIDRVTLDPQGRPFPATPEIDLLGPFEESTNRLKPPSEGYLSKADSPGSALSPDSSRHGSRSASPTPTSTRAASPNRLAPPDLTVPAGSGPQQYLSPTHSATLSPLISPKTQSRDFPKLAIPEPGKKLGMSSPLSLEYSRSPHSASTIPSIRLPPPTASPESLYHDHIDDEDGSYKPLRWWPYKVLPPPATLVSTLFPTLYSWHDKSWWERCLGIIAAPSVFLLTVTLPVIETDKGDHEQHDVPDLSLSLPTPTSENTHKHARSGPITILEPRTTDSFRVNTNPTTPSIIGVPQTRRPSVMDRAADAISSQRSYRGYSPIISPSHGRFHHSPEQLPLDRAREDDSKQWNRWLIMVQTVTAPFFIVVIVWANTSPESPSRLLRPSLYALLASLCTLALILVTTTPTRPPRWRILLCFLGFAVSIAWISSIANEVVGVLKALGVILNISDAILGLTIFAVGNSLGDFVADITVARLGLPIMALSACFGGPMLNILLGIGLSGCYITIAGARRKQHKHPDRPMKFKPYHVDVSNTLMISGVTLLVTLVGLLVAVPMRKWRMDRWIGTGLVALWCISTIGNVVVEILGWGDVN